MVKTNTILIVGQKFYISDSIIRGHFSTLRYLCDGDTAIVDFVPEVYGDDGEDFELNNIDVVEEYGLEKGKKYLEVSKADIYPIEDAFMPANPDYIK